MTLRSVCTPIVAVVVLLAISHQQLCTQVSAQKRIGSVLEGIAGQLWILDSPFRSILSSSLEKALLDELRMVTAKGNPYVVSSYSRDPTGPSPRVGRTSMSLTAPTARDSFIVQSGFNQRVNNPANDTAPKTTQSETSIAVFGQQIVVGFNDSSNLPLPFVNKGGFAHSNDGGTTFTESSIALASSQDLDSEGNLGDPVVASDSQGNFFYCTLFRDPSLNQAIRIGVAKSTDGGENFSAPVNASKGPEVVPHQGEQQGDVLDKPWITVDQNTNTIYVVWTNFKQPLGQQPLSTIQMSTSTDGINFTDARTLVTVLRNGRGDVQ